jgi:short-subunit dehydrogenase
MFKGKTVLITGATSGIGEALAEGFHAQGAFLILTGRNEEKLKKLEDFYGSRNCAIAVMDMANEENISSVAAGLLANHPVIDILVNNAGITQRSLVADTKTQVYRNLMEVNFFGPIKLAGLVLPGMLERKSGHIVAISSVIGKFATPLRSGYAASKMALGGWMDSLRAEVWKNKINVTTVFPGWIKTEISRNALTGDGSQYAKMDENQSMGMDPKACAAVIIKGIKARKREILVGLIAKTKLALFLSRFAPGTLAKMMRKAKVT